MIDASVIHQLKKTNVSTDSEKTKSRVEELFKAASKTDKETIEKLSDLGRSTIYRSYNVGTISAKLAVAMAQTLDINPYYLTGESDDKGSCSDKLLEEFLLSKDKAYKKLFSAKPQAKQGKAITVAAPAAVQKAKGGVSAVKAKPVPKAKSAADKVQKSAKVKQTKPVKSAKTPDTAKDLDAFIKGVNEEQLITLMRSILLRAESGMPGYVDLAYRLKKLLVTEGL